MDVPQNQHDLVDQKSKNSHFISCCSFLVVLQSNTTSIAVSLAIAVALVMPGAVLHS